MKRAVLLCALLAGAVPSIQAQGPQLGRLFSTPEQRSALDAQRYGKPAADPALAAPPAPPPPPPPGPPVELNGVMRRSSGRSTVWLNQAPQNEPHNSLARGKDNTLSLTLSNGQVVLLKPGQRYDPASGTVTEAQETRP
ncbi:hypothetical protein SAMN05216517_101655 [Janthinobacterium sp. OK676]|uniref:hypothetical protein n=1 Tax=Janthinobacterium sp. OK676 TaxID=1855295 RepID=UPI000888C7D1|nr:hypothetical protein [Janthinobacterium sp. OK676]SDL63583.1 hypothetical protein SAMN05216517_101655 [Janthinobacterium sp. OK676]